MVALNIQEPICRFSYTSNNRIYCIFQNFVAKNKCTLSKFHGDYDCHCHFYTYMAIHRNVIDLLLYFFYDSCDKYSQINWINKGVDNKNVILVKIFKCTPPVDTFDKVCKSETEYMTETIFKYMCLDRSYFKQWKKFSHFVYSTHFSLTLYLYNIFNDTSITIF